MAFPPKDLIAILNELTPEEMRAFLASQILDNDDFSARFQARYADRIRLTLKEYKEMIAEALRPIAHRHGFIHSSRAMAALTTVSDLINAAATHLEHRKLETAIPICQAVIEKIVPAFNTIDDSNGLLSPLVDRAFEILEATPAMNPPEAVRKDLFAYCVKSATKKSYQGWDTPWQLANLAASLATLEEEPLLVKLTADLKRAERGSWRDEYDGEQAALVLLRFFKRTKRPGEIEAFIHENLRYPSLRKEAIERAVENKDFEIALALAEEGVRLAKEVRHEGVVSDFLEAQLAVYKAMDDKSRQIAVAETLFRHARHDTKHYYVLKDIMDPAQWAKRRPEFLEKIRKEGDFASLARIHAAEGELDQLMYTLEGWGRLEVISDYEELLLPQHAERLLRLRQELLAIELERKSTRQTYRYAARALKSMQQRYDPEKVRAFADQLLATYTLRPALIEEFREAGFHRLGLGDS